MGRLTEGDVMLNWPRALWSSISALRREVAALLLAQGTRGYGGGARPESGHATSGTRGCARGSWRREVGRGERASVEAKGACGLV